MKARAANRVGAGPASSLRSWWLAVIPVAFLIVFLAYPLIRLLAPSLSLETVRNVLENPYYQGRLAWTFGSAAASTLFTVLLGVPAAVVFSRYHFAGKPVLEALLTLPFVVPTVVAGMGFLALFGPNGITGINLRGTPWLILLANVFYNYALVVRLVSGFLAASGPRLEEAARVLGSNPWRVFWRVTLPVARPAILASSALVFLYCFASFGVPLVLGAGRFNTLEVEIFELVLNRLELGEAGVLALVQLAVTGIAAVFYSSAQSRFAVPLEFNVQRPPARGWSRVWLALHIVLALTITLVPLVALILRAFTGPSGFTFEHFIAVFSSSDSLFAINVTEAILRTLGFAVLTLVVAVPIGLLLALATHHTQSRTLDALSLLPLMVSLTVLGVGFIVAFPGLRASLVLLIAAYTLVAYPFITRSSLTALRAIPPNVLEAARTLGSSPTRTFWRITLPLLRPSLAAGMALAYASVVGEFAATLVLSRPEWATLTTAVFERLSKPGRLGEAAALAVILLVVTTVGFLGLDRARGR